MAIAKRLAVIGGGASAALLLIHLARTGKAGDFSIDVYDRSGRFGRGIAYSTGLLSHRLNVRAANISAFQDEPDDFTCWAAEHGYDKNDFIPRHLYGQYLAERMGQALRIMNVNFISQDVQNCIRIPRGYAIGTEAENFHYDQVVQATGNAKALAPSIEGGVWGYYPDPWRKEIYEQIGRTDKVVLLGSGLSAIDAIAALDEHGFDGEIAVVSRRGWFPRVHAPPFKHPPLKDIEAMTPSGTMCWLRRAVCNGKREGIAWQTVVDSLRSVTNKIWASWNERERDSFMRHGLTAWNIHRHRMSPESAAAMERYRAKRRLTMIQDKVLRVENPCRVICRSRTIEADAVINCLGYRYDESRNFEVSYKIGPAFFGELFETTAIPEIRVQAAEIAEALTAA